MPVVAVVVRGDASGILGFEDFSLPEQGVADGAIGVNKDLRVCGAGAEWEKGELVFSRGVSYSLTLHHSRALDRHLTRDSDSEEGENSVHNGTAFDVALQVFWGITNRSRNTFDSTGKDESTRTRAPQRPQRTLHAAQRHKTSELKAMTALDACRINILPRRERVCRPLRHRPPLAKNGQEHGDGRKHTRMK